MYGTRSGTSITRDYTGTSNAGPKNTGPGGKPEELALKNMSNVSSPIDPHADTIRLTGEGGKLSAYNQSESIFGLSKSRENV